MNKTYTLSTIGLSDRDCSALRRLLRLSKARDTEYVYRGADTFAEDIILVNADFEDAMEFAEEGIEMSKELAQGTGRKQILVLGTKNRQAQSMPNLCEFPLIGQKFLRMLDALVADAAAEYQPPDPLNMLDYPDRNSQNREQASLLLEDDSINFEDLLHMGLGWRDLSTSVILSRS